MTPKPQTHPRRKATRYIMAFGLLLLMCLSWEVRGDDREATEEEDLAPGIKLRIESCGYWEDNSAASAGEPATVR